jgi:hypothetical protein
MKVVLSDPADRDNERITLHLVAQPDLSYQFHCLRSPNHHTRSKPSSGLLPF